MKARAAATAPLVPPLTTRRAAVLVFLGVAACFAIRAARNFLPLLLDPDRSGDDACQHVWWLWRYRDPTLFPDDLAATYFARPVFSPLAYRALFRLLVPWIEPPTISETLPFVLTIPVAVLAWLIGRRAAGGAWLGGVAGAMVACFTNDLLCSIEEGLPRSFALPVLLFAVWALQTRRPRRIGLSFLLTAVFYPPLLVNLGLLVLVVLGIDAWRARALPAGWPWIAAAVAVAAALVAPEYLAAPPPAIGPRVTASQARTLPEFGPGGRCEFFVRASSTSGSRAGEPASA